MIHAPPHSSFPGVGRFVRHSVTAVPIILLLLACLALLDAFGTAGLRPPRSCLLPDTADATWKQMTSLGSPSAPGYRVWRFGWGVPPDQMNDFANETYVVCFVHGNAGHPHESRTVFTELWRQDGMAKDTLMITFDFNEEANIHSGGILMRQAHFVADTLHRVAERLDSRRVARRFVVVGHSMGGIVARAACKLLSLSTKDVALVHVVALVTLATPHAAPPLYVDTTVAAVYRSLATDDALVTAPLRLVANETTPNARSPMFPTVVLSVGSGTLDDQVHPSLTVLGPWSGPFHLHVEPERVEATISDHSSAPWCGSVISPLAVSLAYTLLVSGDSSRVYDVLAHMRTALNVRTLKAAAPSPQHEPSWTFDATCAASTKRSQRVFLFLVVQARDAKVGALAQGVTARLGGEDIPLARIEATAPMYATVFDGRMVSDMPMRITVTTSASASAERDVWHAYCIEANDVVEWAADEREYWPWVVQVRSTTSSTTRVGSATVLGACVDLHDRDASMGMALRSVRVATPIDGSDGLRSWTPVPIDGLAYHPTSVLRCGVVALLPAVLGHESCSATIAPGPTLGQRFNALRNTLTINALPLATTLGVLAGTAWWAAALPRLVARCEDSSVAVTMALAERVAIASASMPIILVAAAHIGLRDLLTTLRHAVEWIAGCPLDAMGGFDQSAVPFAQHGPRWLDLGILMGLSVLLAVMMAVMFLCVLLGVAAVEAVVMRLMTAPTRRERSPRRKLWLLAAVLAGVFLHPAHVSFLVLVATCVAILRALRNRRISALAPALAVALLACVACVTTSVFFVWRNGLVSGTWLNEPSSLEQRLAAIQLTALLRFLSWSPEADDGTASSVTSESTTDADDDEPVSRASTVTLSQGFARWCRCMPLAFATSGVLTLVACLVGDEMHHRYHGAIPGQFNLAAASLAVVCTLLTADALLAARWMMRALA